MTESAGRSLTDRVEELLNGTARVAVPVPEIAEALGTSPAALVALIEDDPRFLVIQPEAFPDLAMLPEVDRSAYGRALREAGVHGTPSIALRVAASASDHDDVGLLLRDSVARLLVRSPEPALLAAAERMRRAVTDVTKAGPDPVETAPSTTPLPDRSGQNRVPPRRRHSPPARPRYPGSRRG